MKKTGQAPDPEGKLDRQEEVMLKGRSRQPVLPAPTRSSGCGRNGTPGLGGKIDMTDQRSYRATSDRGRDVEFRMMGRADKAAVLDFAKNFPTHDFCSCRATQPSKGAVCLDQRKSAWRHHEPARREAARWWACVHAGA